VLWSERSLGSDGSEIARSEGIEANDDMSSGICLDVEATEIRRN
jgi:hypothetical protein